METKQAIGYGPRRFVSIKLRRGRLFLLRVYIEVAAKQGVADLYQGVQRLIWQNHAWMQ